VARSAGVVLVNGTILLTNTTRASAFWPRLCPPQLRRAACLACDFCKTRQCWFRTISLD